MDYNNSTTNQNMNSLFSALASENKGSSPQQQPQEQAAPAVAANPSCPTCGQVQSVMPGSAGQGPSFGNIA